MRALPLLKAAVRAALAVEAQAVVAGALPVPPAELVPPLGLGALVPEAPALEAPARRQHLKVVGPKLPRAVRPPPRKSADVQRLFTRS